jgi:hypothetical protein
MKVKVKCPSCDRFMIITLNREMNKETTQISCVSCTAVFSFRVVDKKKKDVFDSAGGIDALFGKNSGSMDALESIFREFGSKKK